MHTRVVEKTPFSKIPSLADALTSHGLNEYLDDFIEAKIDETLAPKMSVAELRVLLPMAPLGDCLRLHDVFHNALFPVVDLPCSAGYRFKSCFLTKLANEGGSGLNANLELFLVVSSLMLTLTVPELMSAKNKCSDGSSCEGWLAADFALWTASTSAHIFVVVSSMCALSMLNSVVCQETVPMVFAKHPRLFTTLPLVFQVGFFTKFLAMCTRIYINHCHHSWWIIGPAILIPASLATWGYLFWLICIACKCPWTCTPIFLVTMSFGTAFNFRKSQQVSVLPHPQTTGTSIQELR